jgi:hypothetical protein
MEMGDGTQEVKKVRNLSGREFHRVLVLREYLLIFAHERDREVISNDAAGSSETRRNAAPRLTVSARQQRGHLCQGQSAASWGYDMPPQQAQQLLKR